MILLSVQRSCKSLGVKEHVAVLHLLAVLAVHHPHLPANFILQLRQQQRVCVAHRCTLLQP